MSALDRIARAEAMIAPRDPARRPARRPADGGDRLARMLTAHAARAGAEVMIGILSVEPWSSATFSGRVSILSLTACPTPVLADWLATLGEADLPMGRDVIADIAVEATSFGHQLRILTCVDAANG